VDVEEMSFDGYLRGLPFELDEFQRQALDVALKGSTVVVSAPTGSGKTVIAEGAIHAALDRGKRAFYTTPIKALSNQKYGDLVDAMGKQMVGLLTGDNVVNAEAPVVVMTTEVLRNMIYAESDALDDLDVVVLDEVHYLQDPFRGPVWEERPRRLDRRAPWGSSTGGFRTSTGTTHEYLHGQGPLG
jgi:ATP-dependent RNA helicase HelY